MRRALALSSLAILALSSNATAAGDFTVTGDIITVTSLGHELTLPVPAWGRINGVGDAATMQLIRTPTGTDEETLEFIPVTESIDAWTRMLAAMVVARPGYTAADHQKGIEAAFTQGCAKDSLQVGTAMQAELGLPAVIIAACGAYAVAGTGTPAGSGELFVGSITETAKGAVKFYQEWRGKAFNPGNTGSWPVGGQEFATALMDFHVVAKAVAP